MSDEQQQPEDDEPTTHEDLDAMFQHLLGGEKGTEDFFGNLETNPMQEAYVCFHELYLGLQSGGFLKKEALEIMSGYLYRVVTGGEIN